MSSVQQLQAQVDTAKDNARSNALVQSEVELLRDQIVAARRAGNESLVAQLRLKRDELKTRRDADVLPLCKALATAKHAARRALVEADRKELEGQTDEALRESLDGYVKTVAELRRWIKARTAELNRRAQRKDVAALVSKLSPEEKALLKSELG